MPVLGQRKAGKTVVAGNARGHGYVGGHSTADEGRELRRFDNMREERGRGRGGPRGGHGKGGHGGLTVSGEAAAKQAHKTFKPKGPRQQGQRMKPGEQRGENPAEMRTWYVPDGVDTGPSGHRNPDGARGPRKPYGNKPAGARGPGGSRPASPYGGGGNRGPAGERGPRREGGFNADNRSPRGPGGGEGRPQRSAKPYGHPGNAPSFPSDHANPGGFNPYGGHGDQRGPRGSRPGGKPGGGRPFNANGPRGPRPGGGNRGPRGGGGGHHGGGR